MAKAKFTDSLMAELKAAVACRRTRGDQFERLVQQAALHGLAHVAKHGDYRRVLEILVALPNGTRRGALMAWCVRFSSAKLRFRNDKTTGSLIGFLDSKWQSSDFDIEGARRTPFTTCGAKRVEWPGRTTSPAAARASPPKKADTTVSAESEDGLRKSPDIAGALKLHRRRQRQSAARAAKARRKGLQHVLSGGRMNPR
jgi:hypothetical protein